jgi:hypothetical protein
MRWLFLALAITFTSAGCVFEAEPELTCEWIPAVNGIPGCLCSGRQPHDVAEARSVCCAAEGAPEHLCQETPPFLPRRPSPNPKPFSKRTIGSGWKYPDPGVFARPFRFTGARACVGR